MDKIWLKHYPAGVPADIDVNAYPSLVALIDESMAKYASRVAYRYMGQDLRYAQIDEASRHFAAWLQAQGASVQTGTRVQALAPTEAGWQVDGQAFDLGLARFPENGGDREAADQRNQRVGNARKKTDQGSDQINQ